MNTLKLSTSWLMKTEALNDGEAGRLFRGMLQYAFSGEAPDLKGSERVLWSEAREAIDEQLSISKKRAAAGSLGGQANGSKTKQTEANASKPKQTEANGSKEKTTPSDSPLKENTKKTLSKERAKESQGFVPPTLDQVKAYAQEAGLSIDCELFYRYFNTPNPTTGRTWVDAKGDPVRNWKQKMLTWSSKETGQRKRNTRNTLDNYKVVGTSHAALGDIAMDLEEL